LRQMCPGKIANLEKLLKNGEVKQFDVDPNNIFGCLDKAEKSIKKEKALESAVHKNIICDLCDASPIIGKRYKCAVRKNFDLCEKCVDKDDSNYPFICIRKPISHDTPQLEGMCEYFKQVKMQRFMKNGPPQFMKDLWNQQHINNNNGPCGFGRRMRGCFNNEKPMRYGCPPMGYGFPYKKHRRFGQQKQVYQQPEEFIKKDPTVADIPEPKSSVPTSKNVIKTAKIELKHKKAELKEHKKHYVELKKQKKELNKQHKFATKELQNELRAAKKSRHDLRKESKSLKKHLKKVRNAKRNGVSSGFRHVASNDKPKKNKSFKCQVVGGNGIVDVDCVDEIQHSWILKNVGNTDWPEDTVAYLYGHNALNSSEKIKIGSLAVGDSIEVFVDGLITPQAEGFYSVNYALKSATSGKFGKFWVKFKCTQPDEMQISDYEETDSSESAEIEEVVEVKEGTFKFQHEFEQVSALGFQDEGLVKSVLIANNGNVQQSIETLLG